MANIKTLFFHFSQMQMVTIIFFKCGKKNGFFSTFFGSPGEAISMELILILSFGVLKKVLKRSYFFH